MSPYVIVIILFILAGAATALWGLAVVAQGRKSQGWPSTEGVIEKSQPSSEEDDLLPEIVFRYSAAGRDHVKTFEFPRGISPHPQLSVDYVTRYPVGARVRVYYDPADPSRATLEPGVGRGDWMIFVLGASAILLGLVALIVGG